MPPAGSGRLVTARLFAALLLGALLASHAVQAVAVAVADPVPVIGPVRVISGPQMPPASRTALGVAPVPRTERRVRQRQVRRPVERQARRPAERQTRRPIERKPKRQKRSDAVAFALGQVGEPYVWGAQGPGAWDCSGLVAAAFRRDGVRLPAQTEQMLGSSRIRRVSRGDLRRGDLVWPNHGHVAIYLGNGRIVHAANPADGVRVDDLYGFVAGARVERR